MKECLKCKVSKELSEFYKKSSTKDGLTSQCKVCVNLSNKSRPISTEKGRQYRKKYESKPEIQQKIKEEYQRDKEKIRKRLETYRWTFPAQKRDYKKSAKKRNLEFTLSDEQCMEFFEKSCYYCNTPYKGLGIDRVNNKEGYVYENCKPCCYTCNLMKRVMTFDEFKEHINKIYNNLKLSECIEK